VIRLWDGWSVNATSIASKDMVFFSNAKISDRLEGPTSFLASPYFLSTLSQSEEDVAWSWSLVTT